MSNTSLLKYWGVCEPDDYCLLRCCEHGVLTCSVSNIVTSSKQETVDRRKAFLQVLPNKYNLKKKYTDVIKVSVLNGTHCISVKSKFVPTAISSTREMVPVTLWALRDGLNIVQSIFTDHWSVILTDLYPEGQIKPRTAQQCGGERQERPQNADSSQRRCHGHNTTIHTIVWQIYLGLTLPTITHTHTQDIK